jgi:hypothetical protein
MTGDANSTEIKSAKMFSLNNMVNSPTFYPNLSQLDVGYVTDSVIYSCQMHSPVSQCETLYHLSFFLIPKKSSRNKVQSKMYRRTLVNREKVSVDIKTTDWSVFYNDDVNEMTTAIDSYIEFIIQQNSEIKNKEPIDIFRRLKPNEELKELVQQKYKAIKCHLEIYIDVFTCYVYVAFTNS